MNVIAKKSERVDAATIEILSRFGVSTVHAAQAGTGLCKPDLRPICPGARLCGSAMTVLLPHSGNWLLDAVAEQICPGDMVVVGMVRDHADSIAGDVLVTSFRAGGHVDS
jgi:4-hydroxy-4-methyl-2-oxoglutarate aldolase